MNTLLIGLGTGVLFGIFLQHARVIRFDKQINALLGRDMTIIKFMMSAIVVAMIGTYTLRELDMISLAPKAMVRGNILVGGVLFGAGWAIAGYCPGTALGALGEGRYDALGVILGGIVGAFFYSLVFPMEWLAFGDMGKITLPLITGINHWVWIILITVGTLVLFRWFERKGL